ncbi:hypothetical protein [Enterococcus faecium]|nr:hypothetical protein [Enterococcus faecium]
MTEKTIKELAEELGVSKTAINKKFLTKIENFGFRKSETSL